MIKNPLLLSAVLLGIEIFILYLSGHKRFKRYFNFLPAVFWIYFLPMIASTLGLIDSKNPLLPLLSTYLLPMSLFLLLMAVDIKAILRLGGSALIMFSAGSFGVVVGTPLIFFLFQNQLDPAMWSGFGCLAASWTGGSANFIAVKEALNVPDAVLLPMVVVDTVVPYLWMGTLVALSSFQSFFDRLNQSDLRVLHDLNRRVDTGSQKKEKPLSALKVLIILLVAVSGGIASSFLAKLLPEIKNVISAYAWTIIIVSILGILFSFTPARRLEDFGMTKIGYFILYFVLTSIGARADLSHIASTFVIFLAAILIIFFHAGVILLTGRLIRAPMFLWVVASQANIGGVASAPIVAEIYQKGLAPVGLLLAILGNIIGTYLGILTAKLCQLVLHIR